MSAFVSRMAWRETRAAWQHFAYFFVCIALGVAALVGVDLFAANLERAIQREARSLMAADVELRTTRPLTSEADGVLMKLDGRGIARMQVSELVAMAAVPSGTQLVELKAVEPGYPFYGKLRADPEDALATLFTGTHALAEETLLIRLDLKVGDTLKIGHAEFRITGVLKKEPDRAAGAFSFGPRVLISRQGLGATGLVQPGSRVTHRHLLKLPEALTPKAVQAELAATFPDKTARVNTYQDAQPILRRFLRQLTMYLGLVGLIALMVGGIGVASSVRAFMKEKLETVAVLKAIGAGSGTILRVYLTQTILLGVLGSLAGAALGAAFQVALPPLLRAWLPIELEFRLALLPFVRGVGMGLLTTVLFALWPLLEVRHVRPNLILRREVADEPAGPPLQVVWRQGLANLYRPGSQAQTVLVSVGVGVMVILAIHLVERNILWEIGENVPTDAPTFFFIDIQPDQHDAFARLLVERGHTDARLTPLVRSRLWALNGQPVRRESYEDREHGWYFTREYVLTFLNELPKGNAITKGQWWEGGGSSGLSRVSVEEEAARRLGLDLGSTVEFDIQGARVSGRIASIRKVEWGNMSTNFYFIFEPGALEGAPMTYVATTRVAPQEEVSLQRATVAAFPNVSAINIRAVLDSVAQVVDRISLVIRFMAALSILAGAVVLAGALAATRFRRIYEAMIFKAVGGTRRILAATFAVEYALLGAAAGVIGAGLATGLAWGAGHWILDVKWLFQPVALVWGIGATIAGTVLVGFLSTYRILGQKPLPVLRRE